MIELGYRICTALLYGGVTADAVENGDLVFEKNHLEVRVDRAPIGGYRGNVGSFTVTHKTIGKFTEWSQEDLKDLAFITKKFLTIMEAHGVHNTLVYGRQEEGKGSIFRFVPYPNCNWIEKVRGTVDVIFGSMGLQDEQIASIRDFYSDAVQKEILIAPKQVETKKTDAFCRESVLNSQRIRQVSLPSGVYDVLYDRTPKGVTRDDLHFLIVPEGEKGHVEGSEISIETRKDMLSIAQAEMQRLSNQTLIYIERNGSDLQGVKHQHSHVMGIDHFPETYWERMAAIARQVWPSSLTDEELESIIKRIS